jgi:hypothetical protein
LIQHTMIEGAKPDADILTVHTLVRTQSCA